MASKLLLRLRPASVRVKLGHPSVAMTEKVDRPNTLIVVLPDELSTVPQAEFVDKLVSSLSADVISCIQFVPNQSVRVTFTSFDARNKAFQSGIYVGSTRLVTYEADPVLKEVYLRHLPVEVPDEVACEAFRPFGTVHEVVRLKYPGTSIWTGTRLLKVALASDVPVNLRIMRYPCRVFYKDQPRPCSICRSSDHLAFVCPLRGVCRLCREPGHFARDCTKDLNVEDDDADYIDEDNDENDDDEDLSCDDDESNAEDDFDSGDDEVLQSASVPSDPPPRSTRSSSVPAPAAPTPVPSDPSPRSSCSSSVPVPAPSVPSGPPPRSSSDPAPSAPTPVPSAPPPRTRSPPVPASSVPTPTLGPSSRPTRSTSVPVSRPVPMDTAPVVYSDNPRWITKVPQSVYSALTKRPHTPDTHIGFERYDHGTTDIAFDFGKLTYRILKETRFFDGDRCDAYLTSAVAHPPASSFGVLAKSLPPLPADVRPARFPVSR